MDASKPAAEPAALKNEWTTTAIHIPKRTLLLLRTAAFHRAQKHGGRISVSKLVTEIVESHREELEREI